MLIRYNAIHTRFTKSTYEHVPRAQGEKVPPAVWAGRVTKIDRIRAMTAYDDRDPTTCVPRPGRIPYAASAIARSVA